MQYQNLGYARLSQKKCDSAEDLLTGRKAWFPKAIHKGLIQEVGEG